MENFPESFTLLTLQVKKKDALWHQKMRFIICGDLLHWLLHREAFLKFNFLCWYWTYKPEKLLSCLYVTSVYIIAPHAYPHSSIHSPDMYSFLSTIQTEFSLLGPNLFYKLHKENLHRCRVLLCKHLSWCNFKGMQWISIVKKQI